MRWTIGLCALWIVVNPAALTQFALAALPSKRPNIVFILVDDLAWSDLGCYGNTLHDTPHLNRLAREGMRFTQAYAPAPICSASRAAILTGKFPARLQFEFVTKNTAGSQQLDVPLQSPPFTLNLPLAEITLGEMLHDAGYVTGFFGKWHVNQHYRGYLGWSPTHGPLQQGFTTGAPLFGSHPYAYRTDRSLRTKPVATGEFPQDTLLDAAIEFVSQQHDRPFFLYLSQYYVHDPVHSRCAWLLDKYRRRLPDDAPAERIAYGAMVETMDHLVGRVLAALESEQLTDNTLVVVTSDNGGHPRYTSNAPLRGSKWNLYEGGIRVPLLVRWPSHVATGTTCDRVVHGCDLWPTFADIAGRPSESDEPRDGISLVPLLTQDATAWHRAEPLVWHFPYYHPERGFHDAPRQIGVGDFVTSQTRPQSALRSDDWKLLQFHEDDRVELYNLSRDLSEQHNVAAQQPELTNQLRRQLHTALQHMGARFPMPLGHQDP